MHHNAAGAHTQERDRLVLSLNVIYSEMPEIYV